MEDNIRIKHIEVVHLDLSYSHIRVKTPKAVIRIADAMAKSCRFWCHRLNCPDTPL